MQPGDRNADEIWEGFAQLFRDCHGTFVDLTVIDLPAKCIPDCVAFVYDRAQVTQLQIMRPDDSYVYEGDRLTEQTREPLTRLGEEDLQVMLPGITINTSPLSIYFCRNRQAADACAGTYDAELTFFPTDIFPPDHSHQQNIQALQTVLDLAYDFRRLNPSSTCFLTAPGEKLFEDKYTGMYPSW